jgi:NO-binding membrane sensor protein with MHYT domain/nitrogen-specific signal transduction histidine kinase
MLRIYGCITAQHDLWLVVLAGVICLFACYTAVSILTRAGVTERSHGLAWLTVAAVVFGSGVWATHFVAELAFRPGFPIGHDGPLTVLSIMVAIALSWLGIVAAVRYRQFALGGAVVGAAVGAMHYVGMMALRAPADLHWDMSFVWASLAIGVLPASAAFLVLWRGPQLRYRAAAAGLLLVAIVGLHFTGMTAVVLEPNPLLAVPAAIIAPDMLAIAISAVTALIVGLGLSGSIVDQRLALSAIREAAKLRRSQEHLARAQRIAATGSIESNFQTGEIEWSDEINRLFGLSGDAKPHSPDELFARVHPEDRARLLHSISDARNGIPAGPIEYRIVRPDGVTRTVYREAELIVDEHGSPLRQIITLKDVTELRATEQRRNELERQLQHSQRLEAMGTLAGGIAHDLNNTLVPVLALSKLVLRRLPADSRESVNLRTIADAAEHARDLVQQILTFSRKQVATKQDVDMAAVTREALGLVRAGLPPGIEIAERIAEVPAVLGEAGQLHQVVVNLLTNAAQAIAAGVGTITVTLDIVSDGESTASTVPPGAGEIMLTVRDTGCGMDDATRVRIFEPFFTTKAVGEGTGLGLSVVHGIVNSHGGRIQVASEVGKGTRFDVHLPTAAAGAPPTMALVG